MRKNIVIIAVLVIAAYAIGVESTKAKGKNYEDIRHQVERLWTSSDAKKARSRLAKKTKKSVAKAQKRLAELAK